MGWGCKIYPNSQSGNVFIIILVAVALFGALMFTFSRSGSQGVSSISKQEAKIAAQEILNYAKLVEGAVDRVRRNGCSENEISFENAVVAGYSNPNSPPDKSCHVFDDAGGKVSWESPTDKISSSTYEYSARNAVYGIGRVTSPTCPSQADPSQCAELVIALSNVNENVCKELNNLIVGSTNIPNYSGYPAFTVKFVGTFSGTHGASLSAKMSECNSRPNTEPLTYYFYHVLLAR